MNGLKIVSTGRCLPRRVVTNEDLCGIVDTSDEWIVSRTGISARYYCEEERGLDLARTAALIAIDRAGICLEEIGVCIVPTSTADYATPATGSLLQRELGLLENTPCFDISAGCTGFVYGLHIARGMLLQSERPYALLVGVDVLSRVTDYSDRSTCILFGDGAGAAVLTLDDSASYACELYARGDEGTISIHGPGSEASLLHMEGQQTFRFAIEAVPQCVLAVLKKAGLTTENIDWIVPHQANRRILESAAKRLKVPLEKFFINIEKYGNTSAATIPIALDEMAQAGLLKRGQKVICTGFGAGLTWGGVLLEW